MTRSADARRQTILLQGSVHLGVLTVWELLSRFVVPPQFLPPPTAIARALVTTIQSGELFRQLSHTAAVLFLGFGLAIVSGTALGIVMGTFQTLRRVLDPYVNAFAAMPTVALVPLVIIWLGLGFEAKVFLTWIVSIPPVIINAEAGVANVPQAFIETARAFGCGTWQVFRRVTLHAAMPFLVAGIRVGLGRALVGVIVAEMFTALDGLGYMMVLYGNTFRTAELFVPIIVLAMLSIALTHLIHRLEKRLAPWRRVQD